MLKILDNGQLFKIIKIGLIQHPSGLELEVGQMEIRIERVLGKNFRKNMH